VLLPILVGAAPAPAPAPTKPGELPRFEGKDCIIFADLPPEDLHVIDWRLSRLMEDYRRWFAEFSGGSKRLSYKPNVYLYAPTDPNAPMRRGGRSKGHSVTLITGDRYALRYLWGGLQHETSHQFTAACVGGVPGWANEGLASYHGRMLYSGVAFHRGIVEPHDVKNTRKLIAEPGTWFGDVVAGDGFKTDGKGYARAWSIVHFLLHSDDPAVRGKLRATFTMVAAGKKWDEAFGRQFSDVAALEAAYRKFWLAQSDDPGEALRAQARVESLTAFFARAWSQGQRFDDFASFRQAAAAGELKALAADWLPPALLNDPLDFAADEGEWSIQSPPAGGASATGPQTAGPQTALRARFPTLVATFPGVARIEGTFTTTGTRAGEVTTKVEPAPDSPGSPGSSRSTHSARHKAPAAKKRPTPDADDHGEEQ
jgi:hypothetical protein